MRIAIVGPAHPYKGGPAQHATSLAHRLSAAGHETMLQSWRAQYPKMLYPGQLTVDQPEVELFPDTERSLAWYRPDSWWMAGRRLARQRFDAIVLFIYTPVQVPAYLTLARAARAGGCTVIALCNNVMPHERRKLDKPLMTALLRRVDALVVHSGEQADLAATLTGSPVAVAALPPHLPHAGHGVPAGEEPEPPSPGGPESQRNRLLFFGIVRPYKGLDVLLRALAAGPPQVCLTVAGEIWEGRDDLLSLISELGLADRVTLTEGYVPSGDIPAIFSAADALVLPYRSATASQNALIAFQFGIPVIATRAGAIADAVSDGVNGILCGPDDVGDLARAIGLLYQPGELERLRRGVAPPDPGPAWDDYVAAVEKAISAGRT
ncbi:MAG TPA: glycosyl transferase [Actinobacteria bacterium]|nr:glycosyl transferase [Actinomycetota bacterium]